MEGAAICGVVRYVRGGGVHPPLSRLLFALGLPPGGVARKYGAPFEVESCKAKFFEIYMSRYAVPGE